MGLSLIIEVLEFLYLDLFEAVLAGLLAVGLGAAALRIAYPKSS